MTRARPVEERETLRTALDVDDALWRRGMGWALWKALVSLGEPRHAAESADALAALGVLQDRGSSSRPNL